MGRTLPFDLIRCIPCLSPCLDCPKLTPTKRKDLLEARQVFIAAVLGARKAPPTEPE